MRNPGWQSVPGIAVLVVSFFLAQAAAQGSGSSVQLSPGDLSFDSQVIGLGVLRQSEPAGSMFGWPAILASLRWIPTVIEAAAYGD